MKVTSDFENFRVDVFLHKKLSLSRSQIKNKIQSSEVKLNEKKCKASHKLKQNDLVVVTGPLEAEESLQITKKNINLEIVYEDSEIIVVNKPSGLVTYPGAGKESESLVHALFDKLPKESQISNRPGVVHRLDKDTQGLIVLAKTVESHKALSKQFKEKTAKRTYKALCYGRFKQPQGTIETLLSRNPKNRKKMKSMAAGKKAVTHYHVTNENEITEVELVLDTGRTHQIRVHLSELNHPILNDKIYGNTKRIKEIQNLSLRKKIMENKELALVAIQLKINHPVKGHSLIFKTPWPESFKNILKQDE